MLQVLNLSKHFDQLTVLNQFSLTVSPNGFTVLLGPSGCGKSTLFNVLTGVIPKYEGQIVWQGEDLPHVGEKAAYMQQNDLLLPWFSLLENALLPARIRAAGTSESRPKALKLFKRLGLEGFEGYMPAEISGGMRQRCALVRTLMFERELVLLDEPLSALDAITRRSLQSLLLMLQSEFDKSIVMITHDVEEALLLADEVLVLSHIPMQIRERVVLSSRKPRKMKDPELIEIKEHVLNQLQQELSDATI